ncbi:hypothetical protein [Micromonospora lutea]|uniref:Immunity protein 35 domain-containing protein n=1 Tax=Micromonospora lutea TaxID=419825 RepID=A0ABQ4J3T0_9ACTN|nr:hypothetical protein [Micromonospora lutea]GIJ24819.1 hypothetical protein Vlu01_54430 [Micromonospora lutea]
MTEDEALTLISGLLRTENPIVLREFEFGWLARERLSEQERASGMHVGQGSYIIDRSGVITAHTSLPPRRVMEEYAQARREGRIKGRQVWPEAGPTA